MPHLTLEYTNNIKDKIDFRKLFSEIHNEMFSTGEFVLDEIKSRAIPLHDFFIGDGDTNKSFVHLKISMLDNRSDEFKKDIAERVLKILAMYFEKALINNMCQICVELVDLHSNKYLKYKT